MSDDLIKPDGVLRDKDGNPLNLKNRKEVADMSGRAIDKRESIESMKNGLQEERQRIWDQMQREIGALFETSPQLLSEAFPQHNIILCESQQQKERTSSGIFIPKKDGLVNDAIALPVVKVGPETVNVKPGDRVFNGSVSRPMLYPLIDDTGEEEELKWYTCVAENWVSMCLRAGAKDSDFKSSPMPEHEKLSTGN